MQLIENIGFLFYPLCLFSIFGMTIIIERMIFFARLKKSPNNNFMQQISQILQKNQNLSKELRDEAVTFKILQIKEQFEYGIYSLRIIGVLSPMIGLLGTVIGMIKAFKIIAQQNSPVVPAMIAEGLWNAMLTTAYGLIIAIPALLSAFIFLRISERFIAKLQNHANLESFKIAKVKIDD